MHAQLHDARLHLLQDSTAGAKKGKDRLNIQTHLRTSWHGIFLTVGCGALL